MTRSIAILSSLVLSLAFAVAAPAQTITNQPQSITVNNASDATFTVGASGATSYQWQFNGGNLSDGANISGSTNSVLTLTDVNSNQIGDYTVVINGTVTSSPPAALSIVPGTVVTFVLSGFPSGGSNYVDVKFFDHDKPATVQNFLHYIRSNAFKNMFFDRCSTNFVLQGGDYGTSNRTSASPPVTGWDISSQYTFASNQPNPPFPAEIDSEFGVGPVVHNRFGTIAMGLSSGNSNSAASGFFFNLTDNSSSLDAQHFTVFGRILDGTNVLQYFNGLSDGSGIVNNDVFLDNGRLETNAFVLSVVPVNYLGTGLPANVSLFYCDFLVSNAPVDTNPPTVAITSPLPNAIQTNSNPMIIGTAGDDVGLANVSSILTPLPAPDGNYPNGGVAITNYAIGTSNWTETLGPIGLGLFGYYLEPLPPGDYQLSVRSQDGAGNISIPATQVMTNSAVFIVGNGTLSFTGGASASNNPVGYPMLTGTNYDVLAVPGSNQTFVGWSGGTNNTTDAQIGFAYEGSVLTALFISNDVGGIAITSPSNGVALSNFLFNITGTINPKILTAPVTITCQIFTNASENFAVTVPQSTTGTTNWLIAVTNYLPTGSYFIQALATDAASNQTLVTTNFSYVADTTPPTIAITSPPSGAVFLVGNSLPALGTASDSVLPLLSVNCSLTGIMAPDGVTPQGGFSNLVATGTTNWSLDLTNGFNGYVAPGSYNLVAQAVDVASNVYEQTNQITIDGIATNGNGTVSLALGTNSKANPYGYPLHYNTTYSVLATPGAGYAFVDWTYLNDVVANPDWGNFTYYGGRLTANFIPTNFPKGSRGITFTYPLQGSRVMTNRFTMKGTIAHSEKSAQVTCQIFSLTTGASAGPPLTTSGTTTWSVNVSNLAPDVYGVIATASNSSGFGTFIEEAFEVLEFKQVAGTYNGLFLCTTEPVNATNSGFFTITVADSGAWTGKAFFPAYKPIAAVDALSADGTGQHVLSIPGNSAHMSLSLNETNGSDELIASITSLSNSWSSQLICYRGATKLNAHTTPATGKYSLNIAPDNWGDTNGYATLTASPSGALNLSGVLPDGAAFSQSIKTSTNGIWPLYVTPTGYKTSDMLMGWVTNQASGACSGQLYWAKTAGIGPYFTSGVNTNVDLVGTNYAGPAAGSYAIVFAGGSIASPVTNALTVAHAGGQFKPNPAGPADKLAIALSASGVLTGHFTAPAGGKPLQFKGVFLSQARGGSGIVLDSGSETGYFLLEQQ